MRTPTATVVVLATLAGVLPAREGFAQARAALVRSVDEPARVPYFHTLTATCPFLNQCLGQFPAVPAGKRLRLTRISGFFRFSNINAFVTLGIQGASSPMFAFPLTPFSGAYYGALLSFNEEVDVYLEAGQSPVLEVGSGSTFATFLPNVLTLSGYLVDLVP
jgi:hypothetical protein